MKKLMSFLKDEEGQVGIEYALIAGLIALAFVVGATAVGTSINTAMENIADEVDAAAG